ncbi:MAG: carbamoyl-phosphate synthase large subunit, partial [Phenylobacterium sp.]
AFEPTIDYVVTKIPRFAFEKYPGAEPYLTTSMKSVGEVMAIGRTFAESLQKALRGLETGLTGLDEIAIEGGTDEETVQRALKAQGFSDARLAMLTHLTEAAVRNSRRALGVRPVFKRIDTCAGEFRAETPYMYSTYETGALGQQPDCESEPSDRVKAIILGGGPNRIGQGIEFDYCCCHAAFALDEIGVESIMVNCNPETVSTDYDTSDRLYFEPLTAEDVLELIDVEQSNGKLLGVIVQFGGQTPLKLAQPLADAGIPILGTTPDAIDLAEDRERFQQLLHRLKIAQPINAIARSRDEAFAGAHQVGYPVVIRPSYVLGGRAMEIVRDDEQLDRYIRTAVQVSGDSPVLIDQYLSRATEVDVDAICDADGAVFVAGVMEHIEEAGVHSGDSACSLPPFSLKPETIAELKRQTEAMARALEVRGLMNVQFAIEEPHSDAPRIFVLEVNPRASRTVPFVAKTIGRPLAAIAAKVMAGAKLAEFDLTETPYDHIAVKEAVFPFARFPGVDTVLGPEMRSTGEVMGLDWVRPGEGLAPAFARAFAKSQLGGGVLLPKTGCLFVSVKDADKAWILEPVRLLAAEGFRVMATAGTASYLTENGVTVELVKKVLEGRPHIVDAMKNGEVQLVFNTTEGKQSLADSFEIRRTALMMKTPYFTTAAGALAASQAIVATLEDTLEVRPLQSYASGASEPLKTLSHS